MLRKNWWLAALAVGSVLGGQAAAKAQECVDDWGCGPGLKCGWTGANDSDVNVGGATKPGANTGAEADIAAPCAPDSDGCDSPPPPTRVCVPFDRGDCETADDCMDGLECQKYVETQPCDAPEPTQPPDGNGDVADLPAFPPCDNEPTEARLGYCVLPTTVCNSDDDCLLGLTCVSSYGGGSSGSSGSGSTGSGGTADPVPPPESDQDIAQPVPRDDQPGELPVNPPDGGPSTCQYAPPSCENNQPCDAGYACTKVATGSWCDAGEGCPPGVPCDPAPSDCGTDYTQQCLPAQAPCTTDTDCSEGWVCTDFGGEDGLEAPEFWGTEGQAMKSCLPEGIALSANSGNGGGGGFENPAVSEDGKGEGTPGGSTSGHDDNAGESAGTGKGSASGCSVGLSGNSLMSGWLLLGALGLISRRRRRA
jgi:hypothetical protein